MQNQDHNRLVIAVPKGRILSDLLPIMEAVDIIPEEEFFDNNSRKLKFSTKDDNISIIRVRSSDVPTFVNFGGADLGIAGLDVINESSCNNLYTILDLDIGKCRMVIAGFQNQNNNFNLEKINNLRVATKYPNCTREYLGQFDIQVEIVKLNGAVEIAPAIGLSDYIIDLVQTGSTLKENNLKELHLISDISSHLIVNKESMSIKYNKINRIIKYLRQYKA